MENFICCPVICIASRPANLALSIIQTLNEFISQKERKKIEALGLLRARRQASDENQDSNPDL